MTVRLAATLRLEDTPKSPDVVAPGMTEKPKAELLDASGKVIVKSMPPVVGVTAKTDYTLRLMCKTTKAKPEAGTAAIEKVLVATADGKVPTISAGKKLKDIVKLDGNPGDSKGGSGGGGDAGVSGLALALGAAFLLRKRA